MHSRKQNTGILARAVLVAVACLILLLPAAARVVRIVIDRREPLDYKRQAAAKRAGEYEKLVGHAYGELDPQDPLNSVITDVQLAPRNQRGLVEYAATFTLVKPVNMANASGVLLYEVSNRGNSPLQWPTFHAEDDASQGHVLLVSGWQGDLAPRVGLETTQVPVAKNPDGSSITGPVLIRLVNLPAKSNTASLADGFGGLLYQRPASLDTSKATLEKFAADDKPGMPVPFSDWAFADCTKAPFPGSPDPAKVCVKDGFDSALLYQLVFTAKDPLVLGIGLAATRDIVSFFRYAKYDDQGSPNPLAGAIRHTIGSGTSQSGNFIKTFINLGFNGDEGGRMVWDGVNVNIAARQTPINFRFAIPGGATSRYELGSEGVLWWSDYHDQARGRLAAGLLDRCRSTHTCPKIFETFGSTEFWDLRMSPGLVGTKADQDIPLPANVRRYYLPGVTHGGGGGGFSSQSKIGPGNCVLATNPNPSTDTMRALRKDLIAWVVRGTAPPSSRYPRLDSRQLVTPSEVALAFPTIPGIPALEGRINPLLDYDFGPDFKYNDLSGVISMQPPVIRQTLPMLVPMVDQDGNEVGGVPSPLHRAPLGSYLGWNITASGYYKGEICGFLGGFVPFAKTKEERLASGDPRLSLAERYGTHEQYVNEVKSAVRRMVEQRFLLQDDADRLVREAEASDVLR